MIPFLKRLSSLVFGLFLFALGIVTTMKASLGFSPWDVFHAGVTQTIGITIGTASILTSLILIAIVALTGEKLGLGTILNMLLIGAFTDLILFLNFLPKPEFLVLRIAMLLLGIVIISFGSLFYIRSGFGAGPRDSLMVVLSRKSGLSVGLCRGLIEGTVVLAGWLLGGPVGIGTLIAAFVIGFFVQLVFGLARFDATKIHHETLDATFRNLRRELGGRAS